MSARTSAGTVGRPLAAATFPRPEQAKALPVPRDDGLRLDDDDRSSPFRPRARQPHPEEPVPRCENAPGEIATAAAREVGAATRALQSVGRRVNGPNCAPSAAAKQKRTSSLGSVSGDGPQPQWWQARTTFSVGRRPSATWPAGSSKWRQVLRGRSGSPSGAIRRRSSGSVSRSANGDVVVWQPLKQSR